MQEKYNKKLQRKFKKSPQNTGFSANLSYLEQLRLHMTGASGRGKRIFFDLALDRYIGKPYNYIVIRYNG